MARNYKAEYAARQQRARESGFKSYGEQRQLRQLAGLALPGRSKTATAARDAYAVELLAGRRRAAAGKPEAFTDLLVQPKYGTIDIAHLRAQLTESEFAELTRMLDAAFGQQAKRGTVNSKTLAEINAWLADHDIEANEWWAELYGR